VYDILVYNLMGILIYLWVDVMGMYIVRTCGKTVSGYFNDSRYTTTVGAYILTHDNNVVAQHVAQNLIFTKAEYAEVDMVILAIKEVLKLCLIDGIPPRMVIHCTNRAIGEWLHDRVSPYRQRDYDELVRYAQSVQFGDGRSMRMSEVVALCNDHAGAIGKPAP
jgi:hypothetical protein